MAEIRKVFALITAEKKLLLSQRLDKKGWKLPGGNVQGGETDQMALAREVEEKTGLKVEVLHQVGPRHVFPERTVVAYSCKAVNGKLQQTVHAKFHLYATAEEVRQQHFFIPETGSLKDGGGGISTGIRISVPLKLVGSEEQLGCMGRMVWDAFSLMREPTTDRPPFHLADFKNVADVAPDSIPVGVLTSMGNFFYRRRINDNYWCCWPRLDPYSPTGRMQT